jgi:retron-type reverse transcriptase
MQAVSRKVEGIEPRNQVNRKRKLKFVNLYYLMNEELLRECFQRLSDDKAAGIDEVTKEQYAEKLEANLKELMSRLQRMAYQPQPVRRVYIPKAGSQKRRSLGIPCLEDKLVQSALARTLGAIYDADFSENSYGFRPGRSCTVLRGAGTNWRKVEMMWHRRETRRQTENTKAQPSHWKQPAYSPDS